jgi:DNA-binding IscR family transcriptional regulator
MSSALTPLREAGLLEIRGGGYALARRAEQITVADVIGAVDGPLLTVRDERPEELEYVGAALDLPGVWVALRSAIGEVVEAVTLSDLAARGKDFAG